VKIWVNAVLPNWDDDPPEWFNDYQCSIISDGLIEDKELLAKIRSRHVKEIIRERQNSIVG
jgi:hypothetical protein